MDNKTTILSYYTMVLPAVGLQPLTSSPLGGTWWTHYRCRGCSIQTVCCRHRAVRDFGIMRAFLFAGGADAAAVGATGTFQRAGG